MLQITINKIISALFFNTLKYFFKGIFNPRETIKLKIVTKNRIVILSIKNNVKLYPKKKMRTKK